MLRLTLGCLLTEELGIELRRVGGGTRLTFSKAGETTLSTWMAKHARVAWVTHPRPWELDLTLIRLVQSWWCADARDYGVVLSV